MPIIHKSSYQAPPMFSNGHIQTIYPYFFRKVQHDSGNLLKMATSDNDFLSFKLSKVGSKRIAILSHGVEGHIDATYIKGMTKNLNHFGIDVLSWNMRSCGEEMNLQPRYYHAGETEDLDTIINYVLEQESYDEIFLIGFSLGSNLTAKYLGEKNIHLPKELSKAILFSTPVDLACSDKKLHNLFNYQYMELFLKTMRLKLHEKNKKVKLDHIVDMENIQKIKTLWEFTDKYVAPLHGFKNATEYYALSSSKQYLHKINIPTLIVNALNDPILGKSCYPYHEASQNKNLFLETPKSGGHIGFISFEDYYWSERRAREFIAKTA